MDISTTQFSRIVDYHQELNTIIEEDVANSKVNASEVKTTLLSILKSIDDILEEVNEVFWGDGSYFEFEEY